MSDTLVRASITPFMRESDDLEPGRTIAFDFNPESLTIQVTNTLETPGKRSRQRVQYVGSSNVSLSFDAYFDTSRPKNGPAPPATEGLNNETLDVRRRTKPLADLLQPDPSNADAAQRRVRFAWGSILFDGTVRSYNEVLEYFSPDGVPLRAKVSLSIAEQKAQYQFKDPGNGSGSEPARTSTPGGGSLDKTLQQLGRTIADAGQIASQNNLDSLLEIAGAGGLVYTTGAQPTAPHPPRPPIDLGPGVNLAESTRAGVDLSQADSLALFGGDALVAALGSAVDLSRSDGGGAPPRDAINDTLVARRPSSWAPDGPLPGSRAATQARAVTAARAGVAPRMRSPAPGGTLSATRLPADASGAPRGGSAMEATRPEGPSPVLSPGRAVPVIGSPPIESPRYGPAAPPGLFAARLCVTDTRWGPGVDDQNRPRWERLPPAVGPSAARRAGSSCCQLRRGCGCDSHR